MTRQSEPLPVVAEGRSLSRTRKLVHLKVAENKRPLCGQLGRVAWVGWRGTSATCQRCLHVLRRSAVAGLQEPAACNCYVAAFPESVRYSLHWGAHNPACPLYRVSLDPG